MKKKNRKLLPLTKAIDEQDTNMDELYTQHNVTVEKEDEANLQSNNINRLY